MPIRPTEAVVDLAAIVHNYRLVEEGLELREAGIIAPVLVLGAAYGEDYEVLVRHRLTPVIFTPEHVRRLAAAARDARTRASAHLKVDTGMGRVGVLPSELGAMIELLRAEPE